MASTGSTTNSTTDLRSGLFNAKTLNFLKEDFALPVIHSDGDGDGSPGTTGENLMLTGRGNMFSVTPIGTQTINFLTRTGGSGLNLSSGDDVADDGWELDNGTDAGNPYSFVVGTDAGAYYASLTATVSDISEADEFAIGFRISAARQAAIDNYTDMAVLNVGAGANTGLINIETILNNAATTTTSTTQTWADTQTHTLTVIVDSDGSLYGTPRAAYFEIDGSEPTAIPATLFQFDAGDRLMPFVHWLQDETGGASTYFVSNLEWGRIYMGETIQPAKQSLSQQIAHTYNN